MLREMVQRLSLPVRFVIVAVKTSGGLPYEERLDFAFIASQIETGAASYVAYRQPDRIARHMLPAENFYHHLEQHGVDLYLSPRVVAEHLLGDRDVCGDLYARPVGVSSAPPALIGRERETARLDAVLDRLCDHGDVLVIHGEAGIGKLALLRHARDRASGLGARWSPSRDQVNAKENLG